MEKEIAKQLREVAERLEDALKYVEDRIDALTSEESYGEEDTEKLTVDVVVENWLSDLRSIREKLNGAKKSPVETSKNQGKRLVHEFWADDVITDVAREKLSELGIPFTVETERQLRDPSAPEDLG